MKNWRRLGIAIMSLWALFAIHQLVDVLFEAHHWKGLSIGDWGTWVGSIGTVGALIGAIWIATDASRAKESEQKTLALVVTAGLVVRLENLQRKLAYARFQLLNPYNYPDNFAALFLECADAIDVEDLWSSEELIPLVPVPKRVAVRLAWIGTNTRIIRSTFEKLSKATNLNQALSARLCLRFTSQLQESISLIEGVLNDCTAFLMENDFDIVVHGADHGLTSENHLG